MASKKKRQPRISTLGWSSVDADDHAGTEDPVEAGCTERDLQAREKRKGAQGRFPARTHWFEDEIDKSELMLSRPIRKADVIGGRKMVFYQYRSNLYGTPEFAGRRKSEKTSEYRGVYWNKNHKRWEVKVKIGGRTLSVGFHETEEAAARTYDRFITKFIINRLAINFPEEIGGIKLSIKDLVSEGDESLDEANEKVKKRLEKKSQEMVIDFGLDNPEEVEEGCQEWPVRAPEDED